MGRFKKGHSPVFRQTLKRKHSPVLKKLALAFAIVLVATGLYIKVQPYTKAAKLERQLESTSQHLIETRNKLQSTEAQSEAQFNEQQKQLEELNKQIQEKDKQLQAKAASKKAYAATLPPVEGQCLDWMAQAGIPNTYATHKLIINESGCRTGAINPTSGACGIPQAYPCSKLPCPLNADGAVCQLKWMDNYVANRYGSWDNALSTWYSRCGSPQGCWY